MFFLLQALETEAIIPLCLADSETKLVLAGDYMQLVPPVYSPIAKHNCFHITLLERLYDHDIYQSESAEQCRTLLTENYRSHPEVHNIIRVYIAIGPLWQRRPTPPFACVMPSALLL